MQFTLFRFGGNGVLRALLTGLVIAVMTAACQPTESPTANSPVPETISPSPAATSPTTPASPASPSPTASPEAASSPSISQTTANQPSGTIAVETCKVTMVKVSDPNPPLNLRSTPEVKPDNIVGKLNNGEFVTVKSEQNGWLEIASQQDPSKGNGWISKNQTEHSCNTKVARLQFVAGTTSIEVSDRIVGAGSHQYVLKANQGQTLTIKVKAGVAPYLLAPDGKLLAGDGQGGDLPNNEWTGSLPTSGDYKIALDSNYKGFEYNFSVAVK